MNLELRVIDLPRMKGSFNTFLDIAMMEQIETRGENSMPVLIFTEWSPTVSLGNSQSFALDVDKEACARHEVEVVRRRSGGQAVYIDEGYIVFSLIAHPRFFPNDLSSIRKFLCEDIANVLKGEEIPAEFYTPDNIVVKSNGSYRTLGNSGQVIRNGAIALHGSVRYSLVNFDRMLDVLKVNGNKLQPHRNEIESILTSTLEHNPRLGKEEMKRKLISEFSRRYGTFKMSHLTNEESQRISELSSEENNIKRVADLSEYKSRGVCYFFLNGRNIVPSLTPFLAYNKPSSASESTMEADYATA